MKHQLITAGEAAKLATKRPDEKVNNMVVSSMLFRLNQEIIDSSLIGVRSCLFNFGSLRRDSKEFHEIVRTARDLGYKVERMMVGSSNLSIRIYW